MDWKEYTEPDTQEKSRSRNKIKEKDSKLTSLILDLNCNPLKKREKVIEELGEMGEKAVFPLIEAIKSNSNVNIGAVIALVKIGEKAVPLLIEALKDPKEDVRIEVVKALGEIGRILIMEEKKEGKQVVNCLIEALEDENEYVRCKVVESLGEIGDKRAFILLHELLATESDNSVNREIIVAMEKLERK